MEKTNPRLWAAITLGVAIIACLGTIIAALIPRLLPDPTPVMIVVTATSNEPGSVPSTNQVVPSSPNTIPNVSNNPPVVFFNEWVNVDPQSKTIKQVSIQAIDDGTYVNMIGSCSPTDCNFREESPTVVVNYNYDSEAEILYVEWVFDFQVMTQELTITPDNQLRVKTFTHFTDDSGRADFEMVDYFTRQ